MAIFAVGISHHNAPVDIREQFAFQDEELPQALQAVCELPGISEAVIINTCNRVELYAYGEAADMADDTALSAELAEQLLTWLHRWHQVEASYTDRFQHYYGQQAVYQLMRVSAGLDSLVLGEPQIGGQVKRAHALSLSAGGESDHSAGKRALGPVLDRLFQQAFACAKIVRTQTSLGQHPVTVPYAVLSLARQIFSDLKTSKVMLVGAGEMIELCARHFSGFPVEQVLIANRSLSGAQRLADAINAQTANPEGHPQAAVALSLEQLPAHLQAADIVITSTASQQALIDHGMVKQALKARRHLPMLMVDIAVPRDIHPDVSRLPDVYLYTIDDLTTVLEGNRQQRAAAAREAEQIIERETEAFNQWLNLRKASTMLQQFRAQADRHTQEILSNARQQLQNGQPAEQVVEQLAYQLSRRLLHLPTTRLRQTIMRGELEQARQLQDLFVADEADDDLCSDDSTPLSGTPLLGKKSHAE